METHSKILYDVGRVSIPAILCFTERTIKFRAHPFTWVGPERQWLNAPRQEQEQGLLDRMGKQG